eukprot:358037-Chlamydomonas_euryale.AAC.1
MHHVHSPIAATRVFPALLLGSGANTSVTGRLPVSIPLKVHSKWARRGRAHQTHACVRHTSIQNKGLFGRAQPRPPKTRHASNPSISARVCVHISNGFLSVHFLALA